MGLLSRRKNGLTAELESLQHRKSQAKEFVDRHWGSVTKVANAMFEAPDHRLDSAQIERVLAPPMRSAPEMLDGVPFLRRQDGYIRNS
jgi:hypothetical protein